MLARLFIALCRLPGFKKKLWRGWYNYLARSHRPREWTFMNYGFASSLAAPIALAESDEPDRNFIQLYAHVAGLVDLKNRDVLEVGSGRGGGSSFVKRYLQPYRMTGIDLSSSAVEFCRTRHPVEGLEFRVGDAEHIPFPDASFDAVINVESSHCYPSFERFLSEVRRVLRPGGYFLYADFRNRSDVESWQKALRDSGMVVTSETDITAGVLAALEIDNDRKLALIDRLIPRILRSSFLDFAGVRGSVLFESFQSGAMVYKSFGLQRQ